jgi:hypothetical protein
MVSVCWGPSGYGSVLCATPVLSEFAKKVVGKRLWSSATEDVLDHRKLAIRANG